MVPSNHDDGDDHDDRDHLDDHDDIIHQVEVVANGHGYFIMAMMTIDEVDSP